MKNEKIFMNNEELELRKKLSRNERERDRSRKWFFINLFVATFFILFTLWLFPFLLEKVLFKIKWISESPIRIQYLTWGTFFLWAADTSLWLFWVVFRFRKWTDYRHQVHVLKEELDKLEKENK